MRRPDGAFSGSRNQSGDTSPHSKYGLNARIATFMDSLNFFTDREGHLRSGWRLAIFCVAFMICGQVTQFVLLRSLALILHRSIQEIDASNWAVLSGHGSILFSSLVVGWGCGALLEELPLSELGCTPHKGWLKNLLIGSLIGMASLFLATLLATFRHAIQISFNPAGAGAILQTLIVSMLIFVFAAVAEEMMFRSYPLQTLVRANLPFSGVLLTSLAFAAVHLPNPNLSPFTFINTALAGIWLAVAYLRTRSLWLSFGLHWSWNWAQGSLLGLPVSGIERFAPAPLLKGVDLGPDWLTGGKYGIEGGLACTIALMISIAVIWNLKLFVRADVTASQKPDRLGAPAGHQDS